ncbi:MAG: 50S ribosomal protein L34e [Candidatus Nanoarchaeia archaeon]
MSAPRLRSRTLRRVSKRIPGGRTVMHHVKRKPSKARCGNCGRELKAIPRKLPASLKNTPKTQKRPERPFGGVLCSACMRTKLVEKARS